MLYVARLRPFLIAITLTGVVSVPGADAAPQSESIGTFTTVEGRVAMTPQGGASALPVKLHDNVLFLSRLDTEKDSRAKMLFVDDTLVSVGEQSHLEITEQVFDPAQGTRSMVLSLAKGKVRSLVTKIFKGMGSRFEIHTPTAVAAARGTHFVVWIEEGTASEPGAKGPAEQLVIEKGMSGIANVGETGAVDFTSGGKTVRVEPRHFSVAAPGLPPVAPVRLTANLPAAVASAIKSTQVTDKAKKEAPKEALRSIANPKSVSTAAAPVGNKPVATAEDAGKKGDKNDAARSDRAAESSKTRSADQSGSNSANSGNQTANQASNGSNGGPQAQVGGDGGQTTTGAQNAASGSPTSGNGPAQAATAPAMQAAGDPSQGASGSQGESATSQGNGNGVAQAASNSVNAGSVSATAAAPSFTPAADASAAASLQNQSTAGNGQNSYNIQLDNVLNLQNESRINSDATAGQGNSQGSGNGQSQAAVTEAVAPAATESVSSGPGASEHAQGNSQGSGNGQSQAAVTETVTPAATESVSSGPGASEHAQGNSQGTGNGQSQAAVTEAVTPAATESVSSGPGASEPGHGNSPAEAPSHTQTASVTEQAVTISEPTLIEVLNEVIGEQPLVEQTNLNENVIERGNPSATAVTEGSSTVIEERGASGGQTERGQSASATEQTAMTTEHTSSLVESAGHILEEIFLSEPTATVTENPSAHPQTVPEIITERISGIVESIPEPPSGGKKGGKGH